MNDQSVVPGYGSTTYRYYVFGLLFLLYMFDYIDRLVIVSLFPYIKSDWGLTDAQCGMFVSAVYWSILMFTLPASILVDRWSRKKSIGIMSVLWSIAAISCVFTQNFRQLFTARIVIGVGEAGYTPGGTAMISAIFPEKHRARMLGFWTASIPLGSALGIMLGGIIAARLGWRYALGIVALPGFLVAILFFFVKDYETIKLVQVGDSEETQSSTLRVSEIIRLFAKNKTLLFNNLAFACNVFLTTGLMTWLPTYFHRVYQIPVSEAGIRGGMVMVLAIIGAPLGGYLADRWYKNKKNARAVFPAITSFLSAGLVFSAFFLFKGQSQMVVLFICGIVVPGFMPASVAITQDVIHPGLRAMSFGLCVIIQHLLGSSTAPIVIGALSDARGIQVAMMFLAISPLLAGLFYLLAAKYYEQDCVKQYD